MKRRRVSISRRLMSAWIYCPRNSRASSPWVACHRTLLSAWPLRTGSRRASQTQPTWPCGPSSAFPPFEIDTSPRCCRDESDESHVDLVYLLCVIEGEGSDEVFDLSPYNYLGVLCN